MYIYSIQRTPTDSSSGTPTTMKKQAASLFDSDDDDLFGAPGVVPEARSSNAKAGEPSKVNISVVLGSNYWILACTTNY